MKLRSFYLRLSMRSSICAAFSHLREGPLVVILVGALLLSAVCAAPLQATESPNAQNVQRQVEEARTRLLASEGGKIVLRAIEAHGGLEAWYRAPTSAYAWEYSNAGMDFRFKSYLVADNQTRKIYHTLTELGTPDKPAPAQGRFAWDGTNAWISPASLQQPNPRFWATTAYYFESIPFVLADPGIRYEVLPDEELNGDLHDMVIVSYGDGIGDSPGDTYTLYVNKTSGLVSAIRYTVTFGRPTKAGGDARPKRETQLYYEDYVEVDGLKVATRFRGFRFADGKVGEFKNEAWATDISFKQPFDATRLEMPADGRIQSMPGK
jgi:hypothetical protein